MTPPSKLREPGNDGSWFLEAVGVVPAAPTPSEAIAALESENTLPQVPANGAGMGVLATFDGSTGTSTSTFSRVGPVSRRHTAATTRASAPAPTLRESVDPSISPTLRINRSFRLPTIAFGLFLVTVTVVVLAWVPAILRQDAEALQHSYAQASLAIRDHLPTAQTALDAVTDPATGPGEWSIVIPIVSELGSHGSILRSAANEELPRNIPVLSNTIQDEMAPLRDTADRQAFRASEITRRIGHAYLLRTSIPHLLSTGALPTEGDTQTLNALTISLASSLVESSAVLSDLPDTPAFRTLTDASTAAVTRFASWQEAYLMALSVGDTVAAELLIDELIQLRLGLEVELDRAMSVVRLEVDQQIVSLAVDLDAFLLELTQQ